AGCPTTWPRLIRRAIGCEVIPGGAASRFPPPIVVRRTPEGGNTTPTLHFFYSVSGKCTACQFSRRSAPTATVLLGPLPCNLPEGGAALADLLVQHPRTFRAPPADAKGDAPGPDGTGADPPPMLEPRGRFRADCSHQFLGHQQPGAAAAGAGYRRSL